MAWYEHLSPKEVPPRWMWGLDEELDRHFDRLRARREQGHADLDDDDDEPGLTVRNEYAKGRGRAR